MAEADERGSEPAGDVPASSAPPRVLNINVGVLGHVDSGKTSLVAALSTLLSTAALDKHPQSKERGITLDLGFSSFCLEGGMPPHLVHLPYDSLQFTLVDCPGHASLIRTIIGGVHIIDMMLLVIDITKGLQAQTAECLVVAEVATPCMLVVLNKIDLLPEQDRAKAIRKAAKALAQTLQITKFARAPMIPVSAKPATGAPIGVEALKAQIVAAAPSVRRGSPDEPFLMAVDHCFAIKGQGTVLTGTVLQGSVRPGQVIELPALKLQRPVKSMQAFRRPVNAASKGDRVGVCVSQVEKVRFYAGSLASGSKVHVNVGHSTFMAEVTAFGLPDGEGVSSEFALHALVESMAQLSVDSAPDPFDMGREYLVQDELYGLEGRPLGASTTRKTEPEGGAFGPPGVPTSGDHHDRHHGRQWLLLRFDAPVTAPPDALVIGARLDMDMHGDSCRLAFYGRLVKLLNLEGADELSTLKVFNIKERYGVLERIQPDGTTGICRGLFKKETDLSVFTGLTVYTRRGEAGVIEGTFGKSGKFRVQFPSPMTMDGRAPEDNQIVLRFKKYVFSKLDRKAQLVQ